MFKVHQDVTNINNSLLLDSGTCIASLKKDGYEIYIKVVGNVKVNFKDDVYKYPSNFPEELKDIIKKASDAKLDYEDYLFSHGVSICNNNWFEVSVEKDGEPIGDDVVDIENYNPKELEDLLENCLQWAKETA